MRRLFHTQLLVGRPSSKWPVPVAVDIRLADSNGSPLPQALPEHWEAVLQRKPKFQDCHSQLLSIALLPFTE